MALNQLSWNLLGPIHIPSASITNTISTIKSLFAVSSSFWQLVESGLTGSNSIVVRPILNNATASSTHIHVVVGMGVTASVAYFAPHTAASNNERVQIGLCAQSGSFKTFQHTEPFGQNKRWSRYVHCATTAGATATSASFILESEESFFLGFKTVNSGTQGVLIGAIGESFDSGSGERVTGSTGRLYGWTSAGPANFDTSFWGTNNSMFSHNTAANSEVAAVFLTSGGIKYNTLDTIVRYEIPSGQPQTTANSYRLGVPVFWKRATAGEARAIGKPRGIYLTDDSIGLLQYSSGAQVVAYTLSAVFGGTIADTVMFVPASGALDAGVNFGGGKL